MKLVFLLGAVLCPASFFVSAETVAPRDDSPFLQCSDGTSCNTTKDVVLGFGHDIEKSQVASVGDCCAACNQNPKCAAWTVDDAALGLGQKRGKGAATQTASNSYTCWLHYSTNPQARPHAVSALRNTPKPPPSKDGWYPCANAESSQYKFCDTSLGMEDRLADLVPRINTTDAGAQLTARQSPGVPAISLPSYYWGTNAIHGIQNTNCIEGRCPTSFPAPCGLAATFNMSVVKDMGAVIGQELRGYWNEQYHNSLDTWSPTININRDPRWGRNVESPGEDPLLNGLYGSAYLEGLQGNDPDTVQAVVTLKHWFAYNLESYHGTTRHNFDANVTAYDLQSTYWPAWRKCIQENGALGIMCSYNSVNGVPTCTNNYTTHMLRTEWGFKGYITSDSDSCNDVYTQHHYTKTAEEAVHACLAGGTDIDSGSTYSKHLENSVEQGLTSQELVDQALTNSYRMRLRMGLFDPNKTTVYDKITKEVIGCSDNVAKSKFAAQQTMVLLRNEPSPALASTATLPFAKGKKVGVIGRSSNSTGDILGNYIGPICPTGKYACVRTIYQEVAALNGAAGSTCLADDITDISGAVSCAKESDYVVLTVSNAGNAGGGEGSDRDTIGLDDAQIALAKAVLETGKPVALVSINGGLISLDEFATEAPAILIAWMPGAFGAQAVAETLFGEANPGGKMPVTMYPSSYTHDVDFLDMSMQAGPGRSYRFYTGKPLFPFGFGLSYTSFALAFKTKPSTQTLKKVDQAASFSISVHNTGYVSGDEVVQVYVKQPSGVAGGAPVPIRQLVGFSRVTVPVKDTVTINFSIEARQLAIVNANGDLQVASGRYTLTFTRGNGDSDDLTTTINIAVGDSPVVLGSVPKWW